MNPEIYLLILSAKRKAKCEANRSAQFHIHNTLDEKNVVMCGVHRVKDNLLVH